MAAISTSLRLPEPLPTTACGIDHARWIRVQGDLTSDEATMHAAQTLRAASATTRRLIVDAGGVDDVDTKFIAVLVDLHRRMRVCGARLVILPSAAVRRWLRICRLELLMR